MTEEKRLALEAELLEAAQDGDLAAVQRLLGVLGRADAEDHDGNTPLSEAACCPPPATHGRKARKGGRKIVDGTIW